MDKHLSKSPHFFFPFTAKQRSAVTDWLLRGCKEGYIAGPYDQNFAFPFKLHVSPLFVIPKPKLDEWRTIWHGSWKNSPYLQSLNELISESEKHVRYISSTEIALMIYTAIGDGTEAYITAADAADAYYRAPIHPSQFKFMGMKWLNKMWVFMSLQMGLGSACRIYTRFADAIEYILVKENKDIMFLRGVQLLGHYLDDFLAVQPTLERAQRVYNAMETTFVDLNVPTKPSKMKTPQISRRLLGNCYDTRWGGLAAISQQRRFKTLAYLLFVKRTRVFNQKQSEKLGGLLNSIAQLYFPAIAFCRRFQAITSDPRLTYKDDIYVNEFIDEELDIWIDLVSDPKKLYQKLEYLLKKPDDNDENIATDASGTEGAGGIWFEKKLAFQVRWSDTIYDQVLHVRPELKIHAQELMGSWIAFDLWGAQLTGQAVTMYNDNPSAAAALITKAPKLHRNDLQCIIRDIAKMAINHRFMFWGVKIDGKVNDYADALSRFKPYDWSAMGITVIDATINANKILTKLLTYYPNLDKKRWKWTVKQRKILKLDITEHRLANNQTHVQRKKLIFRNRNILTKSSFDNEL